MPAAIRAESLGKQYRLGLREPYGTLRDAVARFARAPFSSGRSQLEKFWALKDVSFEVQPGETLGIVGRNGSGKSTLLKILSRITEPTSGGAWVRGRVGSLLEVGTGFHPELTGRENVFVNGAILGMTRREIAAKFDEIVAFADVDRFIDTPVKHYSSGMQMRLAFAVAAHLEPDILLVDEVLAVGDLAFQKKCLGKMDDVCKEGRTILFVSHQVTQLRRLCTRSLWLDAGRVREHGRTADVINRYEASFMEPVDESAPAALMPGAQFTSWTLGATGDRQYVLDTFGPIVIRFRLRVNDPIRHGVHGLALYDRNGMVMWGMRTSDLDLSPGLYEITYSLKTLPLRPGPYRWHVSIFSNDQFVNNYDSIPEMSVETPPMGHTFDEYAGVLNLPCSVQVSSVETKKAPVTDEVAELEYQGVST